MSSIATQISTLIADPARASLVFAAVVGAALTLLMWGALAASTTLASPLRRRLGALRGADANAAAAPPRVSRWLDRLRPYLEPRKEELRRGLRERLIQAGMRSEHALTVLYSAKLLAAVLFPIGAAMLATLYPHPRLTPSVVMALCALAALIGWFVPNSYLERRFDARRVRLLEGLPDALDLLVACTEAGLGLNAAIERVAEQMPASNLELALELQQVNAEIRAGFERTVALRNLADRTGLEDIRGLVALITHSMRFGTGIAETLRIYSEEFRDRRTQRAEELAAMVGTKLIFPLCFCIFPAFFVVATGPAVVGVMHVLAGENVVFPTAKK